MPVAVVAEEFVLNVAGVDIAAKRWRNGERRVIALHGWLDNAASFDVIAPLLHADIVAVDLAGHGHSYHRPPQASYNIWEDIPDILRLADLLQWPTFSVMGHSRGAIISTVLAAAMPERIESVVLLDGLRPNPVPENDFVDQLGLFLREHLAPPRPPVIYDSIERAITVRCRTGGMNEASAALIVQRGILKVDVNQTHRAWQWRHDPRLRFASAVKMSQENIDAVMNRLATMPHRVYFADRGGAIVLRQFGEVERWSRELNFEILPGRHHFHMEGQASDLAEKINAFWKLESLK